MDVLLYDWALLSPVLATALLAWSFFEPRTPKDARRWADPGFLLPLLWPMYLLHQFEEHGYDFTGARYAFLGSMCRAIGFSDVVGCPADAPFVFAVNVIACPVAFALPYVFRHSRPLLAAVPWGVPMVNAVAHVGAAVSEGAYNPGLVTSLLLFLPLSLWVMRALLLTGALRPWHLGLVFGSGALLHAVLLGSVQLRQRDVLDATGLFWVNALNGMVPLLVGWFPSRWR